jgi:hypothetical protein
LDNCGHHPHVEQEEEVLKNIGKFLSNVTLGFDS